MKKIYLAAPYTSPDPIVRNSRVELASMIAARLMEQGYVVFSPITHGHSVADHLHYRNAHSHEFWMGQCLPMLEASDCMMILPIDGWRESRGLAEERDFAHAKRIPVLIWQTGLSPAPAALQDDDLVAVPRGLIGAACSAIDKKRDAPKTLEQLRRYTVGNLSQGLAAPQAGEAARKTPGMAVQALAAEIVDALLADEKDGGYDLTAGMFGPKFSALVRRWATLEFGGASQPTSQPLPEHADRVSEIAARLRLVAKLAGCPQAVPEDDPTAVGAIFSVLGDMRRAMERAHGITGEGAA